MSDDAEHTAHARSFGAVAQVYAAVRPGYPAEAVEWLVGDAERILDLGAGTGKLTEALIALDRDLVAVDPLEEMLEELSLALPGVPRLVGAAEAIPLDDEDVDAVVAGQAWHWFQRAKAVSEIVRVLRPGGVLGLIWNSRDESADWVRQVDELIGESGAATSIATAVGDLGSRFGPVEEFSTTWTMPITRADFLDLVRSRSMFIRSTPAEQAATLAAVGALLDGHPDTAGRERFDLPYVTHAFRARLR
ncbi:class I SAM-dependent methyltransferase [Agromyces seonyuensis]|uniref:Methyltransferase domain-containing protein n=1 Tax=Agromyces seonyuensis TaxID=2662446 RepID=A0A6I4P2W6_9MICO|nr:class I SAM-dependent methyltransferase [Agromyces seonyuensis]MWB99982.1 methyltransferase domain-containing protein [Agromyces seonyuensis]